MNASFKNQNISEIAKRVNSGTESDIDFFMSQLTIDAQVGVIKLIDFAISQVKSTEGINRLKYYLYNGSKIQRNYAALYFKRHKYDDILLNAAIDNCIDENIIFSR